MKITKQGAFNSGRLYAKEGQQIAWFHHDNGVLFFKDVSRMVWGYIPFASPEYITPSAIMSAYDNGTYETWRKDMRCEYSDEYRIYNDERSIDFGPKLNI